MNRMPGDAAGVEAFFVWRLDTPKEPGLYWVQNHVHRKRYLVDIAEFDGVLWATELVGAVTLPLLVYAHGRMGEICWGPRDGAVLDKVDVGNVRL